MILGEEVGEANQAALEHKFALSKGIKGRDSLEDFRKEIVQVAAVAVNILRSLARNELNPKHLHEEKIANETLIITATANGWVERCAWCKGECRYGNPVKYVHPGDYVHPRRHGEDDSTAGTDKA